MGILGWIVFGLVVGAIAKLLMPGRDPGGIIVTMVLGIVGALLGGFVGRALGMYGTNESAGFIMALVGAVFVLFIYRMSIGGVTARFRRQRRERDSCRDVTLVGNGLESGFVPSRAKLPVNITSRQVSRARRYSDHGPVTASYFTAFPLSSRWYRSYGFE